MLEKSAIIALIVFGLHYIMYTPGMIFSFVADWAARIKMPNWLSMPLFACPICAVPYYGSLVYWFFLGHDAHEWVVCLLTATGINSVIVWLKLYSSK